MVDPSNYENLPFHLYENIGAKYKSQLVAQYPFIAKTLRDVDKKSDERRHCCGMTLQNEGIGYKDLDDLFKKPCDLEFIIHLISVELPEEYQKERWQLSDDEKILRADYLHQKGNELYIEKKYELAEKNYFEGIGIIENLMLKEKPHDTEWLALADKKIPLLSNYCQCRLLNNDYYSVIIHCTEVLKLDPSNKKALFRRGKAHTGAWNPKEARADFEDLLRLDPRAKEMVAKELKIIDDEQHKRDVQDKCKLKKLF